MSKRKRVEDSESSDEDDYDAVDDKVVAPSAADLALEREQRAAVAKRKEVEKAAEVQKLKVREKAMVAGHQIDKAEADLAAMEHLTAAQLRRKLMIKRKKAIYSKLNPEQMDRYEKYNDCNLSKSVIKKTMISVLGSVKVPDPPAIAMAGICKVFAGDLVENALMIMVERNDTGPIRPVHLREAYRRLYAKGVVPSTKPKSLFN